MKNRQHTEVTPEDEAAAAAEPPPVSDTEPAPAPAAEPPSVDHVKGSVARALEQALTLPQVGAAETVVHYLRCALAAAQGLL